MGYNISEDLIHFIQAIAKKYAISKIVMFGSRARGDAKSTSDIDLAIYTMPEFSDRGYFTSDIDELNTLLKIDLVFISDRTEQKLLDNIAREGVTIYERL